jgi:predicted enzyme related to lactoylglutathione lyase
VFERPHHMQLAMPRGQDEAARRFFAGVVGDLDEVVRRLRDAGQDVTWAGDDFPGFRRAYANDPFGNRLEFLEPVQPTAPG